MIVRPPLTETAHDRAAERRGDVEWQAAEWPRGRALLLTADHRFGCTEAGVGAEIVWRPTTGFSDDPARRVFLGVLDGTATYLVRGEADDGAPHWCDLRQVGEHLSVADQGLVVEAVALARWHDRHLVSPIDGSPTEWVAGGWYTRSTSDGSLHFPRTDPAVIMLVHDGGDRCVLGRGVGWSEGRFSLLAGFVEPGETLEAAVARETKEEVGLDVTDIHYVGSQPWPFPSSIMLGFVARAVDPSREPVLDPVELAEARWFTKREIDEDLRIGNWSAISIAQRIIHDWAGGHLNPSRLGPSRLPGLA